MNRFAVVACVAFGIFAEASGAPAVTPYQMTNYVNKAIRQAVSGEAVADDSLSVENGRIVVYEMTTDADGVITNVPKYYTASSVVSNGTYAGAVVVRSNTPFFPKGMAFANVAAGDQDGEMLAFAMGDGAGGRTYALSGMIWEEQVCFTDRHQTVHQFVDRFVDIDAELSVGSNTMQIVAHPDERKEGPCGHSSGGTMKVRGAAIWAASGKTNALFEIELQGCMLTRGEWLGIVTNAAPSADLSMPTLTGFAEAGGIVHRDATIVFEEYRPLARRRLLKANTTTVTIAPVSASPYILHREDIDFTMEDSFKYATNGETAEDYFAEPEETPNREQWDNIWNWVSFPDNGVSVPARITEDGYTYDRPKYKIKTAEEFVAICKASGIPIVPQYETLTFTKKESCEDNGHIYGAHCICIVCKTAKRDHVWGAVEGFACQKCVNHFDAYDTKWFGSEIQRYPTGGELEEQCKDDCDVDEEDRHGGWHSVDVEGDDTIHCQCECGYYSPEGKYGQYHTHKVEQTQEDVTWSKLDKHGNEDGIHHFAEVPCERNCGKTDIEFKEEHLMVATDYEESVPVDNQHHRVSDVPCARECGFIGDVITNHVFKTEEEGASGMELCYCKTCKDYFHEFSAGGWYCGDGMVPEEDRVYIAWQCARCGEYFRPEENAETGEVEWRHVTVQDILSHVEWHAFGKQIAETEAGHDYREEHICMCNSCYAQHIDKDHNMGSFITSPCIVCQYDPSKAEKTTGYVGPKKYRNGTDRRNEVDRDNPQPSPKPPSEVMKPSQDILSPLGNPKYADCDENTTYEGNLSATSLDVYGEQKDLMLGYLNALDVDFKLKMLNMIGPRASMGDTFKLAIDFKRVILPKFKSRSGEVYDDYFWKYHEEWSGFCVEDSIRMSTEWEYNDVPHEEIPIAPLVP